jgi:Arc/MetJ-type ribon-helix-helix transcriptional regulator
MTDKHTAWLGLRIPPELMEDIEYQRKQERRANRSEMVRLLIEDGLWFRNADYMAARWREDKPPTDGTRGEK